MTESTPLTHDEERVLQAVARLEAGDDTATIRRVADETDLDPQRAEAILGELDDAATGVGRQYAVKKGPAPRS